MLIKAERSALLVIDIQEKLAPAMNGIERVVENTAILMRAARRLAVPLLVSEQYPKGLGATVAALAANHGEVVEKITFSCLGDEAFAARFDALGRDRAVIAGIEAHVCVLQTAMDLLDRGAAVFVVADATASRSPDNRSAALRRLRGAGAEIVTTEMVIFEWLGQAGTDEFKELSKLIK